MVECRSVARNLDAFRTGELKAGEARAVQAHLHRCLHCRHELSLTRRLAGQFSKGRVAAPEGMLAGVLRRLADGYGSVKTEMGVVQVAFSSRGISFLRPAAFSREPFESAYRNRVGRAVVPRDVPREYAALIRRAASGAGVKEIPVDLSYLPPFEQQVLEVLATIPRGEVRPYGWLAYWAGRPGAARAVGNAMARNPIPILLPCHRVVPSSGGVGGYAFGPEVKRSLLIREEAPVDSLDELAAAAIRFVGSRSTRVFCYPSCHAALRIGGKNRVLFGSVAEAAAAGYRPCKFCRPV